MADVGANRAISAAFEDTARDYPLQEITHCKRLHAMTKLVNVEQCMNRRSLRSHNHELTSLHVLTRSGVSTYSQSLAVF